MRTNPSSLAAVFLAASAAGCNVAYRLDDYEVVQAGPPAEQGQPPIRVAWISKGLNIANVYDPGREGALAAAADITASGGRPLTVDLLEPETTDVDVQAAKLQEAIDKNYDAICLAVGNADKATPLINQATAKGIKVVTFDTDAPQSDRVTYYSIDNALAGKAAARALAKLAGRSGDVIVVTTSGTPTQSFADRLQAFTTELASVAPAMKIVESFGCSTSDEPTMANCTKPLQDVAASADPKYANVRGWFFNRGRALREIALVDMAPAWSAKALDGTYVSVGMDTLPEALPNAEFGLVNVLIGQKYWGWGYDVVWLAQAAVAGKEFDKFTDSKYDILCKDASGDGFRAMQELWEKGTYRNELPRCSLGD